MAVFTWVLARLAEAGLVRGKTIGIDATTLEANAAMRSIERRETGESYEAFARRLAEASGVETPTRAELARFDRSRKKKASNKDWKHPLDPDATITKMKDGRTHLAHKAEHGVDLDTGAIVSATVQEAAAGDPATLPETLIMAAEQVEAVRPDGPGIEEVTGDKRYHSDETLVALEAVGVRSYLSEPDRGRRRRRSVPHSRPCMPIAAAASVRYHLTRVHRYDSRRFCPIASAPTSRRQATHNDQQMHTSLPHQSRDRNAVLTRALLAWQLAMSLSLSPRNRQQQ